MPASMIGYLTPRKSQRGVWMVMDSLRKRIFVGLLFCEGEGLEYRVAAIDKECVA